MPYEQKPNSGSLWLGLPYSSCHLIRAAIDSAMENKL
jgi:hypothetical protein